MQSVWREGLPERQQGLCRRLVGAMGEEGPACRRGDGEIILSLPAKLLAAFHGLLPGTTTDILSWLNRALPATGESAAANVRRTGYESETAITRSPLTALTRKAAAKNNE